jgi:hypothetical protein
MLLTSCQAPLRPEDEPSIPGGHPTGCRASLRGWEPCSEEFVLLVEHVSESGHALIGPHTRQKLLAIPLAQRTHRNELLRSGDGIIVEGDVSRIVGEAA